MTETPPIQWARAASSPNSQPQAMPRHENRLSQCSRQCFQSGTPNSLGATCRARRRQPLKRNALRSFGPPRPGSPHCCPQGRPRKVSRTGAHTQIHLSCHKCRLLSTSARRWRLRRRNSLAAKTSLRGRPRLAPKRSSPKSWPGMLAQLRPGLETRNQCGLRTQERLQAIPPACGTSARSPRHWPQIPRYLPLGRLQHPRS
jgi:hypothetical protein